MFVRRPVWKDPRVAFGFVHLTCVLTIAATLTTFFAVGHNVREVCELIKESTLYKSFKVNRDKVCLDRLPTISYTGVLLPEQCVFAVGLSLAAFGGFWAFYLIGRIQAECVRRHAALKGKGKTVLARAPPVLWFLSYLGREIGLEDLCRKTGRLGQVSSFWMLPTACVSMKHSIIIHGLSAFFFFGLACIHVVCTYCIQHNLILHEVVSNKHFERSCRFKKVLLRCAAAFFGAGVVVYFSLRFTPDHLYLYTLGGALGQYTTVVWLMSGFSTYYVDLTVLLDLEESNRQQDIAL